ncbi:DUF547 domain-containing protein [Gimesia panareensis]|uniref:DUF547 domain-containing protein n=1 Tax=Gimesia panareensis TaxID=2527978 RepID=UPI00118CBA3F|nr:DUF547 domain-containing protein [Gimesia panareensis]QDU52308.1 hypothetical protein Pan110_46820 [Gimesia panareensis]
MRLSIAGGLIMSAVVTAVLIYDVKGFAKEPLGQKWAAGQLLSMDQINHSSYNNLLKRYVDQDGYVNYTAWKRSAADRQALQKYLTHLSQASTSIKASRESQLAFWINAYNAVTLEGILQVYPTKSIRDHTAKIGGYNIWDDLPLLVGSRAYSLNDIEHKVLRKMGEPRIHFAIVCASVGCPRLLNEAYTPESVNQQLAMNAQDFFSRPQNFMIDKNGTMQVSSILDWFGEDFGNNQAKRFSYLQPYLPQKAQQYAVNPQARVKFQKYDWSLNDQAHKPAGSGIRSQARSGTR